MDGVLIIDKPVGVSSHDVVSIVKRIIGAKKVGHLGTLDPDASGVLPLVINGATKFANKLAGSNKVYEFILKLGMTTDTDDATGKVLSTQVVDATHISKLKGVLRDFTGDIMQRPPIFSAKKIRGKRAYQLAHKGESPSLEPVKVTVNSLEILDIKGDEIKLGLDCEKGTYVRSLCRDIGYALGVGGHARAIRRLKSGPYTINKALRIDVLKADPSILWQKIISLDKKDFTEQTFL